MDKVSKLANLLPSHENHRKQRWNNILQTLTTKYGTKGDKAPQIIGDYRDHLCVPPPQKEPENSFSLIEIERQLSMESNKRRITKRKSCPKPQMSRSTKEKRRKILRPIHNLTYPQTLKRARCLATEENGSMFESETDKSTVITNSVDDNTIDDNSDIEFLCEETISKEPQFFYFQNSKKKCLRYFIAPY